MRPYQVFAAMQDDQAEALFKELSESSGAMFTQAVYAASSALKSRPTYLLKQPFARQASAVRRALARVGSAAMAEEVLAVYFLECRKELLVEWLDLAGIEHEEGTLKEDELTEPEAAKLTEAVGKFREGEDGPVRELLLQAFAAQGSIEWPTLEELIASD